MVRHFTITDWTAPYGSDNEPGLLINFEEFNIVFPTIQIYKRINDNEFQLMMNPMDIAILLTNRNVHIIGSEPFNGTIVIK